MTKHIHVFITFSLHDFQKSDHSISDKKFKHSINAKHETKPLITFELFKIGRYILIMTVLLNSLNKACNLHALYGNITFFRHSAPLRVGRCMCIFGPFSCGTVPPSVKTQKSLSCNSLRKRCICVSLTMKHIFITEHFFFLSEIQHARW